MADRCRILNRFKRIYQGKVLYAETESYGYNGSNT